MAAKKNAAAKTAASQVRLRSGTAAERFLATARFDLIVAKRRNQNSPSSTNRKRLDKARQNFLAAKRKVG